MTEFMHKYERLLLLCEAAVMAFAFFSLFLCLSRLPDVMTGPLGYGKATPSWAVRMLTILVPTQWFAFGSTPVVFWIALRRSVHATFPGMRLIVWLALFSGGLGILVLGELLTIHGAYAVESTAPSSLTQIWNAVVLLMMLGFALHQELRRIVDGSVCRATRLAVTPSYDGGGKHGGET